MSEDRSALGPNANREGQGSEFFRTLLMVGYHFPPSAASGSHRLLGFARHLPKFGWQTTVVAPPSIPWEPVDPDLMVRVPRGAHVYHVPYRQTQLSKPFRYFAAYVAWWPGAWLACRKAIRKHRPAALLTSGPPHSIHLLGYLLSRTFGLPWLVDFRDPWVATRAAAGGGPAGSVWDERMESIVMRGASVIIVNAPLARSQLQQTLPKYRSKIVSLTNGFDPEVFPELGLPAPPDGAATIVHPGQVYAGRNPIAFLDALAAMKRDGTLGRKPISVRFMGRLDDYADELADVVRQKGLADCVSVSDQVSYAESLRQMTAASVLLLLDSPGRRIGVPGKVYEYIGAGRPVLALGEADGDLAWVLRESGVAHRIAPPGDPDAIKRALAELLDGLPAGNPEIASRSRFTRENVAGQLAGILEELLGPNPGVRHTGLAAPGSTKSGADPGLT